MQVPSLGGKMPWRRAWQPSPVFLPGGSHGQRSPTDRAVNLQRGSSSLITYFCMGKGTSLIWGVMEKGWGIHIDLDWKLLGFQFSNVNIHIALCLNLFFLFAFCPSPFIYHFATGIHKFCFLLCNTWLFNWFSLTTTCIVSPPFFFQTLKLYASNILT